MERGESDEDPDEMEELRRSEWTATWREARMNDDKVSYCQQLQFPHHFLTFVSYTQLIFSKLWLLHFSRIISDRLKIKSSIF